MPLSVNKIQLSGRIGNKDVGEFDDGTARLNMSVYETRKTGDEDDPYKGVRHNVSFIGGTAALVDQLTEVGNQIYVEGQLRKKQLVREGDQITYYYIQGRDFWLPQLTKADESAETAEPEAETAKAPF